MYIEIVTNFAFTSDNFFQSIHDPGISLLTFHENV